MFDFKKDYRFTWPVKILVPTEEGQQERKFTGIFRLVPEAELRDAHIADPANADATTGRLSLVGWKDDLTTEGKSLPYSTAAHEELLTVQFVRYAIAKAYYEAIGGALREKN